MSCSRYSIQCAPVGIFHILEYGIFMEFKPQDLLVSSKRVANPGQSWTYAGLAACKRRGSRAYASLGRIMGLSASSQVHRSVQRGNAPEKQSISRIRRQHKRVNGVASRNNQQAITSGKRRGGSAETPTLLHGA